MKYFNRNEFACRCNCGFATVDYELAIVLDELREHFNSPASINSGCRCETHNKKIGGSANSKHINGTAADVSIKDVLSDDVYDYLDSKYPNTYGIGRYNSWTHIDIRSQKARW